MKIPFFFIVFLLINTCFNYDNCDHLNTKDKKCDCKYKKYVTYIGSNTKLDDDQMYYHGVSFYSGERPLDLGNFYLCEKNPSLQYFIMKYIDVKFPFQIGFCTFSDCSLEHLNDEDNKKTLIETLKKILKIDTNIDPNKVMFSDPEVNLTDMKNENFTIMIVTLSITGVIILLYLLNIILYRRERKMRKSFILTVNSNDKDKKTKQKKSILKEIFKNFNFIENLNKIFTVKAKSNDPLRIFDGIRFFSASWVVLGHSFFLSLKGGFFNISDLVPLTKTLNGPFIYSALFSVDVFFYMASFMLYLGMQKYFIKDANVERAKTLSMIKKRNENENQKENDKIEVLDEGKEGKEVKNDENKQKEQRKRRKSPLLSKLTLYGFGIFARYIRLFPLYFFCLYGITSLMPFLASGPRKDNIQTVNKQCFSEGWKNLLYINNFFSDNCAGHTWYLANDMQFFIIFFGIFLFISFSKVITFIITNIIFVGSVISAIVLAIGSNYCYNDYSHNRNTDGFFDTYYVRPYIRIGPYILGLYFCELYLNCKAYGKFKESKNYFRKFNILLEKSEKWSFFVFAIGLFLINYAFFAGYITNAYNISEDVQGVMLSINKILFVIGLGLIVHLTFLGKFQWIYHILSIDFFNVMGKLTFGIYIVHMYIVSILYQSFDMYTYFNFGLFLFYAIGFLVLASFVSLIVSLLFESPIIGIMKVLMGKEE